MTIYDIAKEAGVSASTVSRVYNNKPGIKASTRERITELLNKYNYFPDAAARGLVSSSSKIVGILVSDIRTIHHTEGAYIIERELAKLGFCCIIFNTGSDPDSKRESIQIMASRKVEAVVMIGSTFQTESVRKSIEEYLKGLPIIIVNGYIDLPNVYGVLADEKNGVASCVKYLKSKGYKNPAYINNAETFSNKQKQDGFIKGMKEYYRELSPLVEQTEDKNKISSSFEATGKLIKEHPETDAIIYSTDLDATFGLKSLREHNKKIPEDIAVIGIDNSIYGQISFPTLTSLDNKILDLSTTCAGMLTSIIDKKKVAQKMLIFSEIVEREST